MDAIDAILSRRSIRRYTSKPVPEDLLNDLLKAAMSAPSAGNEQPWHFIIITDRKILNEIPGFHPYSHMLKEAQVAVVVCADIRLEKFKGFWVQDCSAASENLLIAAHAKGLGAVWTGIYPDNDRVLNLKKLLNLPEDVMPLSLIPIGWPAEKKEREDRFQQARIHYNKW